MAKHNETGIKGEKIAVEFLKKRGMVILEQNWRFNRKEIDIIAKDKEEIVVIEVKTRSTDYYGEPEESVTEKKQEFLIEAAEEYLNQNEIDYDVRFDVISIVLSSKQKIIHHIENAFYPLF